MCHRDAKFVKFPCNVIVVCLVHKVILPFLNLTPCNIGEPFPESTVEFDARDYLL